MPIHPLHAQPTQVVVVGHVAWAQHFWVDSLNASASKTQAHRHQSMLGGMGANAAVAAARLGAQVRLISRVGDDSAADAVQASLTEQGIDTTGILRVRGKTTSQSSVVIDRLGERWIVSHRGSAVADDPPELDTALLAGAHVVLVDPRWSAGAKAALCWARRNGVLSVLDADVCPAPVLSSLVAQAQWAAFSLSGLRSLFADTPSTDAALTQALAAAVALGAENALVTLGERGAAWLKSDARPGFPPRLHRTKSPRVQAQDTTGAGDVFHAAFALFLAQGQTPEQAQAQACVAAALKCANGAGVFGAPTLTQLQTALSLTPA